MHYLSLASKRMHWAAVAKQWPLAEKYCLTPARFDLLYVIRRCRVFSGQAEIARRLGVSQATVSRMLRALEGLGFIRRGRTDGDRRRNVITFTERGGAIIDCAIRRIIDGKTVHAIYQKLYRLGSDTRYAVSIAKDATEARAAYHAARRYERARVYEQMEAFFGNLDFTTNKLRYGFPLLPVYEAPSP